MTSFSRPPNHLLRMLPSAEFEALRAHIRSVEMVKDAVLAEAGRPLSRVYLPHDGASHPVEACMSRWLLRANELWDDETPPMTQELLARMIGVQRNAISIVAHALQQARVMSYSRRQIEINDVAALQRSACECHSAVKMRREQLFGNTP
jgi:hypothetical protein